MDVQPLGLEERRSRIAAAREALVGLADVLYEATGPELGELMSAVDGVAAQAAAARVTITVEAVRRGQVAEEGVNAHAWVRDHAPSLRQGGAGDVARVVLEAASLPTDVDAVADLVSKAGMRVETTESTLDVIESA